MTYGQFGVLPLVALVLNQRIDWPNVSHRLSKPVYQAWCLLHSGYYEWSAQQLVIFPRKITVILHRFN